MASEVFFRPLHREAGQLGSLDLAPDLAALTAALGLGAAGILRPTPRPTSAGPANGWALKVQLDGRNRPPAISPAWARQIAQQLPGAPDSAVRRACFAFDTLSITTDGLDRADTHLELAQVKGFAAGPDGLAYRVADGPDQPAALAAPVPSDSHLAAHTVAGGLAGIAGYCLLTPVRPHPHAGLGGALMNLGAGLADRPGKLALHKDIRPKVDTPLCAGCGSCLAVCLFDAIKLQAGRATIDHQLCTGCGECMNVCFMAGIEADAAIGIPAFQAKVADAAVAARNLLVGADSSRQVYFNFLIRLERQMGGARSRGRTQLGDLGILAGRDPVAVDQATSDLISGAMGGSLALWSGFRQLPEVLLARAESVGMGSRAYRLETV